MNIERLIPHHTDAARDFFKGFRKDAAISRIKSQPFYRPRTHGLSVAEWTAWLAQIGGRRRVAWFDPRDEQAKRADALLNAIASARPVKMDEDTVKAVLIFGSAGIKTWLEPDGSGGLVGMSQCLVYDKDGNLTEVGDPAATGATIKL